MFLGLSFDGFSANVPRNGLTARGVGPLWGLWGQSLWGLACRSAAATQSLWVFAWRSVAAALSLWGFACRRFAAALSLWVFAWRSVAAALSLWGFAWRRFAAALSLWVFACRSAAQPVMHALWGCGVLWSSAMRWIINVEKRKSPTALGCGAVLCRICWLLQL